MKEFYSEEPKYLVAVDCVIFGFDKDKLKLLIVKRGRPPKEGSWSLMGGFLQLHDTLEDAGQRILTKWTGLEDVYLKQFYNFSKLDRDLEIEFFPLLFML